MDLLTNQSNNWQVCLIPNLNVIRPADGNETNAAWKRALAETERPAMLVLTRQNLHP